MVEVSLRTVGTTTVVGIGGSSVDVDLLGRVVEGAGAFDSEQPLVIDLTSVALDNPVSVRRVLDTLDTQGLAEGVAVVCENGALEEWSVHGRPDWLHATVAAAVAAVGSDLRAV